MKAAIFSTLAAGAALLGACATTPTETAHLSSGEMVSEFAALSQGLRDLDAVRPSPIYPETGYGAVLPRRIAEGRFLYQVERLQTRRETLRDGLDARRGSLTADEISVLIAEIDRELASYDENMPGPVGLASGGEPSLRQSQWRRIYRL